jgi:hypothetical protein
MTSTNTATVTTELWTLVRFYNDRSASGPCVFVDQQCGTAGEAFYREVANNCNRQYATKGDMYVHWVAMPYSEAMELAALRNA